MKKPARNEPDRFSSEQGHRTSRSAVASTLPQTYWGTVARIALPGQRKSFRTRNRFGPRRCDSATGLSMYRKDFAQHFASAILMRLTSRPCGVMLIVCLQFDRLRFIAAEKLAPLMFRFMLFSL